MTDATPKVHFCPSCCAYMKRSRAYWHDLTRHGELHEIAAWIGAALAVGCILGALLEWVAG